MTNNQRLSDILGENSVLIPTLLKFSKKENLESFQNGTLYLNNFQYFKDLELEEQQRGQGDAFDLTLLMSEVDVQLRNPETDEVIITGRANVALESPEDYQRHVFCSTAITPDLLEVIEMKDNVATTRLVLPEELKLKALENFGDHVMLINAPAFFERLDKVQSETNISYVRNRVSYKDMSINRMSRIQAFNSGHISFYFEKDNFFAYQNEYRLLFPELVSDKPEIINIGSIKDFTNIIETETLINGELRFKINLYEKEPAN